MLEYFYHKFFHFDISGGWIFENSTHHSQVVACLCDLYRQHLGHDVQWYSELDQEGAGKFPAASFSFQYPKTSLWNANKKNGKIN